MGYEIWLSYDAGNEKIHFPVNPEEFITDTGDATETVDIIGLGEILLDTNPKAKEFSFSSFLPWGNFPGKQFDYWYNPYTIKAKLQSWKDNDRVCYLVITGMYIWEYVKIGELTWTENGGDVGTQHFDITLKQYREPNIRQVSIVDGTAQVQDTEVRVDNTVVPQTYTVVSGDSLYNIAKRFYGDGSLYTKIYETNMTQIGSNPNAISAGMVLSIPE